METTQTQPRTEPWAIVKKIREGAGRFLAEYGMILVLLLLVGYYSWATLREFHPTGEDAARIVSEEIQRQHPAGSNVLIAARGGDVDLAFVSGLQRRLQAYDIVAVAQGTPAEVRQEFARVAAERDVDVIATTQDFLVVVNNMQEAVPELRQAPVATAESYRWPTFLQRNNLINVANQIVVIAIIAIGMTMVIITAGIDLSVGSLVALSAVIVTILLGALGGANASTGALLLACLAAILACGLVGLFSGVMVAGFRMPSFIVTLGMMQVASGLAYIISGGGSIYEVPPNFTWLGRGADFLTIPNAVVLLIILYAVAHVVMSRTTFGRYIYAVGGNEEAARLSGVRVKWIHIAVYSISGLMAGLGGIILASQLNSGAPTYGLMYELHVIAAVVVGGTSLYGGQGKILGTLIGALIIGVIQNGMNLTGVESYTQKVVLGLVILGAVLLDMLRKRK